MPIFVFILTSKIDSQKILLNKLYYNITYITTNTNTNYSNASLISLLCVMIMYIMSNAVAIAIKQKIAPYMCII